MTYNWGLQTNYISGPVVTTIVYKTIVYKYHCNIRLCQKLLLWDAIMSD